MKKNIIITIIRSSSCYLKKKKKQPTLANGRMRCDPLNFIKQLRNKLSD